MLTLTSKVRSRRRRIANGCCVSVFLCYVASGQIGLRPEDREAIQKKSEFVNKAFLKCTDSSLTPPAEVYYFGPASMPTGTVSVPAVFEYIVKETRFDLGYRAANGDIKITRPDDRKPLGDALSLADGRNHVQWRGIVTMQYPESRMRRQGLTKPETPLDIYKTKPNGVWGAWTKWENSPGTLFEVAELRKESNVWSIEAGPGLQSLGLLSKLSNDVSGGQGSPFYSTFDQIAKAKPPSCEALSAMLPNATPERAPGHSLSDSYQRTQTIARDNASKGISDTVNPSYVRRLLRQTVCHSIDAAGTCHSSGEGVWVPGDLEQPLDWNEFLRADACSSPQSAQIEIVLKGPLAQDNRRRVIRCQVARHLAQVRNDLIDLGVKDGTPPDIEAMKTPPLPPASPGQSFAPGEMPATGVIWMNGDPTFKDGTTTVKLSHSLIVVEQGSASARFSLTAQGMGINLVPPPATSHETYNTQTHQYVNSSPGNGDATGNYPKGPPPGMMRKLGPFAQAAMKAINRAKQTPGGAAWDDQYFRNILEPYNTTPASNLR